MNKFMSTMALAALGSLTLAAQSTGTLTPQEKKNQDIAIVDRKSVV